MKMRINDLAVAQSIIKGVNHIKRVYIGRSDPQREYYPIEEIEDIFDRTWKKLRAICVGIAL